MNDYDTKKAYSNKDLVDTLASLKYGYSGFTIADDVLGGAYILVSQITGYSTDQIDEMIKGKLLEEPDFY